MIPTAATNPASTPTPTSATIGIASLILEGRALSDDDFIIVEGLRSPVGKSDERISGARTSNCSHHRNTSNSVINPQRIDSSDPTTQHFQRIRQKLGQLRQSSPGTSRDHLVEQEIVVGSGRTASNVLSNDLDDNDDGELTQFIQRKQKPQGSPSSDNNILYTLQSLASTCLRTTPRSFSKNRDLLASDFWFNSTSSTPSTITFSTPASSNSSANNRSLSCSSSSSSSNSSSNNSQQSSVYVSHKVVKIHHGNRGEKGACPKQGPHCDQFFKKIGMKKGEASEAEEHICDMANLNEICYRWQIHCRQIEAIMSRSDPICIEVYLGPENHEILLEQWIIEHGDKNNQQHMTLQSLCNAIRSQLYFSQITAWTDLIKKSNSFDKEILENVRIKTIKNGSQMQKPRLDILYRIKAYDSTACFNSKPNIHNFPCVIISDSCAISVSLKSLPRLPGGIPKIDEHLGAYAVVPCGAMSMACESGEQSSTRDDAMMLDDRLNLPCQEKGKHKCAFDEEEGSSDAVGETVCMSRMSHREKQLMKYRKRMMKRDKKTKKPSDPEKLEKHASMQLVEDKQMLQQENRHHNNSDAINQQTLHEFGSINSIRPPLYQTTTSIPEAVQTNAVEMVSIGTQTANFPFYPTCDQCGKDMQFICWNCDKKPQRCANGSAIQEPIKLGKGDILLQAIERTPRVKGQDFRNNNNTPDYNSSTSSNSILNDCQLCKRQKTGHHYNASENNGYNNNDMSKFLLNSHVTPSKHNSITNGQCSTLIEKGQIIKEKSQTGLSPRADKCGCAQPLTVRLNEACSMDLPKTGDTFPNGDCTVPSPTKTDVLTCEDISAQFRTPKTSHGPKNQLKPSLLHIDCSEKPYKSIPKVNLTNIFCSPSSPIPITTAESFTFNNTTPEIPVQKSNSAPTLPNSPSLSPRFLKQAAIYKRRSRHLSDRSSERSSFGSDEQFSDEDLDSVYSPATSPIKNRLFLRCSLFGRKSLLGNLEESLLQKRFMPKTQVAGFKVLLGASGGFCPTQLTIPAATYFYELSSHSLSTPYVCEIRLSRKGYTVPRTGTVQATLLNPLGTVVRMFVIPYDFRDMPPMSQTFIRQRILAVDSNETNDSSSNNKGSSSNYSPQEISFSDQMKQLRYSIHLRFQTSRSGRLALHTDIRFLISRRTDCDTAAAHAKGALESPNDLRIITITPDNPKYCSRQENPNKI